MTLLGDVTALLQTTQLDLRGLRLRGGEGERGSKGALYFFGAPTPMATAL